MKPRSVRRGKRTSSVEVTNVSGDGFRLLLEGRELYLSFEAFPWFRRTPIEKLTRVEMPSPGHLYWPALDVDLAVESIEHPERFPLISKVSPKQTLQRPRRR